MRPEGQPPSDRIARVFLTCPCHRGGGAMTSFSPPTLASECRLCRSRLPARDRAITNSQPLQWPAALPCSEEQREGEEAANARSTSRAKRVSGSRSPRRLTLESHRLLLARPQSSGRVRNSHVSLNPLSSSLLRPAIQKVRVVVQKLWRMRLLCGRQRKTKK
jgi:hypothetical protein